MEYQPLAMSGLMLLTPQRFSDERGFFVESFRLNQFQQHCGPYQFVQENISASQQGVLRGLHYQLTQPQGKLLRVSHGEIFDVVVDLRQSSPTFGQWLGLYLNAAQQQQFWIPPGFAHGFLVLSESAEVCYKTTDYYAPASERSIRWDDSALNIAWPLARLPTATPCLSVRDQHAPPFALAEYFSDLR